MLLPLLHYWWSRPDALQWVWIGVAFSIVAAAIGLIVMPTVFQQFWGAPRLRVEYGFYSRNRMHHLRCSIVNDRVHNRFLRFMRVRTTAAEVVPQVMITPEGGGSLAHVLVVPFLWGTRMDMYVPEARTVSTASSVTFDVATMNIDEDHAVSAGDPRDQWGGEWLSAGMYIAEVRVDFGEDQFVESQRFVVAKGDLYWVDQPRTRVSYGSR